MPKDRRRIRVPSLQHFSVLLGNDVAAIERRIVQTGSISVSYQQLRTLWTIDLIRLGVPLTTIEKACHRLKGNQNVISNAEALSVFAKFLQEHRPANLLLVEKAYFPIGRNLRVPVNPAGVITIDGRPSVFWPSFWKKDKFTPLTRAVFGTILERSLFPLSDFRDLPLTFLDCSFVQPDGQRSFKLLGRSDFGSLSDAELRVETDKFADAYHRVTGRGEATRPAARESERDSSEPPLFLDSPPD